MASKNNEKPAAEERPSGGIHPVQSVGVAPGGLKPRRLASGRPQRGGHEDNIIAPMRCRAFVLFENRDVREETHHLEQLAITVDQPRLPLRFGRRPRARNCARQAATGEPTSDCAMRSLSMSLHGTSGSASVKRGPRSRQGYRLTVSNIVPPSDAAMDQVS